MPALVLSMSPAKLNSTVVPVKSFGFAPGIIAAGDRHSGNLYETLYKVSGAEPRITLNMPWKAAYDVIGLGLLKLTTFELQLSKFSDYIRDSGSVHPKWALSASATAVAIITGHTVDLDGDLLATVDIVPLAASAAAHPLTKSNSNAPLTLSSQPTLHTLGPLSINGTVHPGLRSAGGDLGQNLRVLRADGDRYARNAGLIGATPRLTARSVDPSTLRDTIGELGINITSNVVQYFRQYNATTGEVTGDAATGVSFTVASGRIEPGDISLNDQDLPEQGLNIIGLSSSSTHPWAISTAATVPST